MTTKKKKKNKQTNKKNTERINRKKLANARKASPKMEDNGNESLKNCFNVFHALNSYQIWILAFERT